MKIFFLGALAGQAWLTVFNIYIWPAIKPWACFVCS